MTDLATSANETIEADIVYAVDTGETLVNQTMPHGDMSRVVTGTYSFHRMPIHNGRQVRDRLALDVTGFVLVDQPTAVTDFQDPAQIQGVYYPEMERLIAEQSGAARVVLFDHTLRSGDDAVRKEKLMREPVRSAHNDYTEVSAPRRIREIMPDEAEELLQKRYAVIQVWRAIRKPIEADPLTICDARSFDIKDLLRAERRYPHRVGETYRLAYNPSHEWYYFPKMTRDEALVFKVYDSDESLPARMTPHTSFTDPTVPDDAPARESIEARAFAFFDD
jgi:hypothetical protein